MTTLEFFFDYSSPWTYLAFTGIQPILVGGVFNAVNPGIYHARNAMFNNGRHLRHYQKDLGDWADYYGLEIGQPAVFPVMRGAIVAAELDQLVPYAKRVFETYWGQLRDIADDAVLAAIAEAVGIDHGVFFERISARSCKDQLRANGDELIEHGGFGSPTLFIGGDDMYFGNDRLPLVEWRLAEPGAVQW